MLYFIRTLRAENGDWEYNLSAHYFEQRASFIGTAYIVHVRVSQYLVQTEAVNYISTKCG